MDISDDELLARYPALPLDHDTKAYWKGCLQKKLLINRCQDCGRYIHYPRPKCPHCWSTNVLPTQVSGRGTVYLLSFWHQSRDPAEKIATPYPAAAVELIEQPGLRIGSTIVKARKDEMKIGLPVVLTWIDWNGAPVPAFEPARSVGA